MAAGSLSKAKRPLIVKWMSPSVRQAWVCAEIEKIDEMVANQSFRSVELSDFRDNAMPNARFEKKSCRNLNVQIRLEKE